ncbi:hypothetical protein DPX16_10382 [Anabarilius grahami]|uniref:Uncharacterized protein n=1 Tax=Anabarilius grahami TaxID=495550 RepID=A0A3N0Y5U2_ANAGA|nr:hypothetical protein DPX16_10382 [Anabarilius grahami]
MPDDNDGDGPALGIAVLAKAALAFLGAVGARALTYLPKLHYAANITNDSADTPVGKEAKLAAPQRGTRPAKWAGRHPIVWGDSRELPTSP